MARPYSRVITARPFTPHERRTLERWAHSNAVPARLYKRARILLWSVEGLSSLEIAGRLELDDRQVRQWIKRFNEQGLEGLDDRPRPGQPRRFTDAHRLELIALVSTKPRDHGHVASTWTVELLRQTLIEKGVVESISVGTIHKWLQASGFTYRQSKRWLVSNDPEFEAKKGRS